MPVKPYNHPRTGKPGWQIKVYLKLDDGRQIRKSKIRYGITAATAERIHDKWKADLIHKHEVSFQPDRSDLSIGDVLDGYIEYAKVARRTWKPDFYRCRPILAYFGSGRSAASILPDDLLKYMKARRQAVTTQGRPMAPASVDREIQLLKSAYNHASRNQKISPPYNPAQFVSLARVSNKRERVISDDEMETILKVLSPFHRMIFFWARFTGLRQGQLLSLQWSQIDKRGLILPQDFRPGEELYRNTKGFGQVPIPEGFPRPKRAGRAKSLWTWRGHSIQTVRTAREYCQENIGFNFHFHDFRRTYATWLRSLGVGREVRMSIMGHSLESEVHDRYQIIGADEILEIRSMIEKDESYVRLRKILNSVQK